MTALVNGNCTKRFFERAGEGDAVLVKNIFDDLAIGLQASRNDADLMKLHLAVVDKPENLFGRRGDFIVDAESTRRCGSASVSESRSISVPCCHRIGALIGG